MQIRLTKIYQMIIEAILIPFVIRILMIHSIKCLRQVIIYQLNAVSEKGEHLSQKIVDLKLMKYVADMSIFLQNFQHLFSISENIKFEYFTSSTHISLTS